jgi:hypothetical protein
MQMLCALLIFDTANLERPLAELSPWLDMQLATRADVVARLDGQTHRRFIKTHTPLDGLPRDDRVTYVGVGRDPRDVAISQAHHLANLDLDRFMAVRAAAVGLDDLAGLGPPPAPRATEPAAAVAPWFEADPAGNVMCLEFVLAHLTTFWERQGEPGVMLFHYGDLSTDLPGQMRRLADALTIGITDERIAELAGAATFGEMRRNATRVAPNADVGLWRSTEDFFHRGSVGQWPDVFDDELLRRYGDRVAELVSPELAKWLHSGWLGTADSA